jgi:hypothetical protein
MACHLPPAISIPDKMEGFYFFIDYSSSYEQMNFLANALNFVILVSYIPRDLTGNSLRMWQY